MTMNELQMIALPLEGTGLLLAGIEIFKPHLAKKIDIWITNILDKDFYIAIGEDNNEIREAIKNNQTNIFMLLLLLFLIFCPVLFFLGLEHYILLSFLSIVFGFILLQLTMRIFNKFFGGRAIGGLGLILALAGITIEAIQVWSIPQRLYVFFVIIVVFFLGYIILRKPRRLG